MDQKIQYTTGRDQNHDTSIDGVKVPTKLRVADNVSDYLEVIAAEVGKPSDSPEVEAVICRYITDSRKLERNAKVRGPYQKVLTGNRKAAEDYAFKTGDPKLFEEYRQARTNDRLTEFLDKLLDEDGPHYSNIHGVKALPRLG
jgi:hypothetical protein